MTATTIRRLISPLSLGGAVIDHYSYYEQGDVLYLTAGPPRPAADDDESLEGGVVFLDNDECIIGVTIVGAREMLDRDGTLNVTLPSRALGARFSREEIELLLVETLRHESPS